MYSLIVCNLFSLNRLPDNFETSNGVLRQWTYKRFPVVYSCIEYTLRGILIIFDSHETRCLKSPKPKRKMLSLFSSFDKRCE